MFFDVVFHGVRLQVPLSYIESAFFSFCHLHQRLFASLAALQCSCANTGPYDMLAQTVRFELPIWLLQNEDIYLLSLSALPVSRLSNVVQRLRASHLC